MADTSWSAATYGERRRFIFDLPSWFPIRPELYKLSQPYGSRERQGIFDFLGLPAELRNLIYSYAITSLHDPQSDRVCLIRQKPGEYRDFTGLPLVCKTIHKEYTTTLARNTTVNVLAEDVSAYIDTFYPNRDAELQHGDLQVSYIAYGKPVFGSSLCDNFELKSSKLDVVPLLSLQHILPWVRVSFLCYRQSFINVKPMRWHQLTDDFNDLFSAKPVQGPALPGADPRCILPRIFGYLEDRTNYELTVSSRWPNPGDKTSYHPAIIFSIKYNAAKNPDLPFSEHWRNKSELKRLAHTFWNVDKLAALADDVEPRYDKYNMMALLHRTGLGHMRASQWFVNFQREYFDLDQQDSARFSKKVARAQEASNVTEKATAQDASPFHPFTERETPTTTMKSWSTTLSLLWGIATASANTPTYPSKR